MDEPLEAFSSDFSLGAWNDFGKFSDSGFEEGVEGLDGVSLEKDHEWGTYLGEGEYGLPQTEQETQEPYSFISPTTENSHSYEFEFSLDSSCFVDQSSVEAMEIAKDSNWDGLLAKTVCQNPEERYCHTLEDDISTINQGENSRSSTENQTLAAPKSNSFIDNSLMFSTVQDLKGSTSAQGRKMTPEERALMLYKRKLRNRESAAKTRKKRSKTINQIGQELEELRQRADLLSEHSSRLQKTEEENKKLVEENSHLRSVINQYAVELSSVRYKLKLFEDSVNISQAVGSGNNDILSLLKSGKRNVSFDSSLYDQRNMEAKKPREMDAFKDVLASYPNEKVADTPYPMPFSSQVTTLDVLEQVSNEHVGNMKVAFSGRDRRRAIAATNVFLRERSMN